VFVIVKHVLSSFMITSRIFNTTGVTHGAGAAYRSEIPELVRLALFILSIASFHDLVHCYVRYHINVETIFGSTISFVL
jgi:hypothetical protein